MRGLLTGGAGFICSHTAVELLAQGHEMVVYDNFSSSSQRALPRLSQITGRPVPRRAGDVASCYAKIEHAQVVLGWRAEFDLPRMCADAWRWQSRNLKGCVD